ncbi:DsbA family oxidoreductase [Streptomyces sp. NPDC088341]|uniref:DsbA family oxidoreductase n=1 Tax=Streptomyces sp. NPDC088341 TaxID=3154870 RepID=UPI0034339AFA
MEPTTVATPAKLRVDVWADVVCPWCYLGEHRLSRAVETSPHADHIELKVHAFQLDPDAPAAAVPTLEYLAAKLGASPARARAMEEGMARTAEAEGLPYAVDRSVGNTRDMLRLVRYGAERGVAFAYLRAMQAEVFGGGPDAFGHATLVRLGERLGLPGDGIRDVLSTDRYADAVRADQEEAVRLGVTGVPFTVVGGRLGIPGAVSAERYSEAIDRVWEETHG